MMWCGQRLRPNFCKMARGPKSLVEQGVLVRSRVPKTKSTRVPDTLHPQGESTHRPRRRTCRRWSSPWSRSATWEWSTWCGRTAASPPADRAPSPRPSAVNPTAHRHSELLPSSPRSLPVTRPTVYVELTRKQLHWRLAYSLFINSQNYDWSSSVST